MSDVYKHLVLFLLRHLDWMERFSTMKIGRFFFVRVYDITQTELLFAQSLQSICSVYVDTPRVILLVTDFFFQTTRDMFNNASAQSAFECFVSECKCLPRCLQVLAFQVDRCIARKSKMPTKTIMGFREALCTQYFQIRFLK